MLAKILLAVATPFVLSLSPVPQSAPKPAEPIRGFVAERTSKQRDLEGRFLALPSPKSCEKFSRILTEDPHMAGTAADRKTAEYVRSRLLEQGFEAEIVEYQVYLPYPKSAELTLLAPESYTAKLKEEGWPWDKDMAAPDAVLPFNAYSPSGDVTADLVYANYGLPEDYDKLAELGVDPKGKVVIVRYGQCFRGVKVKVAEEHGAAACIIYSDPADDGYAKGDVYPRGPWRPETGVQRGSIHHISEYPGDPLSPGWPAVAGARRIEPSQSESLPKIPAIPLSYGDATPLLKHLAGPNVPEGWQGHLPFAYHVGPGPSRVRIKLEMEFKDRPIWNVIGTMPGAELPDQWVIVGNHRDAWVHGAVDPTSGSSVVLELARSLGELRRQGWRPRRTIVLASWDGEEFGLIGSTEWVEEHADILSQKAVAYLNVDSAVSGPHFAASGVPGLADFVRILAREIPDPKAKRPVYDLWLEKAKERDRKKEKNMQGILVEMTGEEAPVGELGSGSDFTPFLDRLGIPCLDLSFGGPYGVYHSVLDNFYWMSTFGDPGFEYHATMSRILGLGVLRLSECDLLPLDPAVSADAIGRYLSGIEKTTKEAPAAFSAAQDAARKMRERGREFLNRAAAALISGSPAEMAALNSVLVQVETAFIDPEGLRGRPWFRNLLFAPGLYTGYAPATLPGVREAAARGDADRIQHELGRLTSRLDAAARLLSPPNAGTSPPGGTGPEGRSRK